MSKHTSGPWQPWNAEFNPALIVANVDLGPDGEFRCDTICEVSDEPRDWVANARLIAAAPDLLAALKAAIGFGMVPKSSATEGGAMKYVRQAHVADQIRAAIAKAEGRT